MCFCVYVFMCLCVYVFMCLCIYAFMCLLPHLYKSLLVLLMLVLKKNISFPPTCRPSAESEPWSRHHPQSQLWSPQVDHHPWSCTDPAGRQPGRLWRWMPFCLEISVKMSNYQNLNSRSENKINILRQTHTHCHCHWISEIKSKWAFVDPVDSLALSDLQCQHTCGLKTKQNKNKLKFPDYACAN